MRKGSFFLLLWLFFAVWVSLFPAGIRVPGWLPAIVSLITVFCYITFAASFSRIVAGFAFSHRAAAKVVLAGCGLFVALFLFGYPRFAGFLPFVLLQSLVLFVAASLLGALLSAGVGRIGELVPLALTAATADIISVFYGPTKSMGQQLTAYYGTGMAGTPPLVDLFLLKAAAPGGLIQPLFGVSDWILIILFSSALFRLGKNDNLFGTRTLYFPSTAAGLFVSLVVAGIAHLYIPALVFICLFFLADLLLRCRAEWNLMPRDIVYSLLFPGLTGGLLLLVAR